MHTLEITLSDEVYNKLIYESECYQVSVSVIIEGLLLDCLDEYRV